MSLAELRDLAKAVDKAITHCEVRQKAEARNKFAILAHELGYTFDELAAEEGPKSKRATSTTINKHPESPTITWSSRGHKPAWYTAHLDADGKPKILPG
ncbi:H-NS histone family protein [Stagnihabitans tardus]|uniref:H-NS histone family protein n=1 Tax=Stagnihabitans tardus TaxID=2699202 RepID=A0AAE5BWE6_9RHOB|nr:H-NS histone family protein [Stagnihabitans tardus]NBZ89227.1 H-NS histone family protein [Stagnihabitans tardus]